MTAKIKIHMFGKKNEVVPTSCGWGPSTACGPGEDLTTMEMYKEVKTFLEGTDIKDKIEMNFIDLETDDLNGYEDEMKIVEKRSEHPITFIEGKPAFVGNVDKMRMYLTIRRILKKMK